MKRFAKYLCLMCLTSALSGCMGVRGSGTKAEETRHVPAFTSIEVKGGYDVTLTIKGGAAPETVALTLSGDDNLLPLIESTVADDKLVVDSEQNLNATVPLTLRAEPHRLRAVALSGSGDFDIAGVAGDEFNIAVSGSGDMKVRGKTGKLSIAIAGSGDIDAQHLEADSVTIAVAGSGDVSVCAAKSLEVEIAGSGTINYYCDPKDIKQDITGSGELIKK